VGRQQKERWWNELVAVKYKREYNLIIKDMVNALEHLEGHYKLLGLDDEDWEKLNKEERNEYLKTMSHDIIYGLGGRPVIEIAQGAVCYEPNLAQIRVYDGDKCVYIVWLN